ncbi:MAG: ABC transporter substrate-binding protein [Gammaproteobacteria bacterium]
MPIKTLCRHAAVLPVLLLFFAVSAAKAQERSDFDSAPEQIVQELAGDVLRALDEGGARPAADSAELYALVDRVLRPRFDFAYASRLVLGRFYKDASPAEREAFVNAFYDYLVRVYSHALLAVREDTLAVSSSSYGIDKDMAVVRTIMRLSDGIELPVDYRMRATDGGWKIWDVVARGVSYVKIYRADFGAIAGTGGVGALNDWLDSQQRRQ